MWAVQDRRLAFRAESKLSLSRAVSAQTLYSLSLFPFLFSTVKRSSKTRGSVIWSRWFAARRKVGKRETRQTKKKKCAIACRSHRCKGCVPTSLFALICILSRNKVLTSLLSPRDSPFYRSWMQQSTEAGERSPAQLSLRPRGLRPTPLTARNEYQDASSFNCGGSHVRIRALT